MLMFGRCRCAALPDKHAAKTFAEIAFEPKRSRHRGVSLHLSVHCRPRECPGLTTGRSPRSRNWRWDWHRRRHRCPEWFNEPAGPPKTPQSDAMIRGVRPITPRSRTLERSRTRISRRRVRQRIIRHHRRLQGRRHHRRHRRQWSPRRRHHHQDRRLRRRRWWRGRLRHLLRRLRLPGRKHRLYCHQRRQSRRAESQCQPRSLSALR
jgi:hypothetical protein